ncbi:MAG: mechanosensitive ion channel family protein [Firmicutes bacterium]|nr:mechanosensitive ion channel family protein [Bacillota bacterium]
MEQIGDFLLQLGMTAGVRILEALVVLVVGCQLIKWLLRKLPKGIAFSRLDKTLQSFALSFIKVLLYVLLFLILAYILGLPTTSLITVLASAGIAVGLALQGALSNLAGGLMILLFKPFKIGDYIEAGSCSGYVEKITIFYTIIRTIDNRLASLPNGALTNSNIINYTANPYRLVCLDIGVAYGADIQQVKQVLMETAKAHPLCELDQGEPLVALNKYGESSLDFILRAWVKTENYWDMYFSLNEQIKAALDQAGIEIPFPQMDVHLHQPLQQADGQ